MFYFYLPPNNPCFSECKCYSCENFTPSPPKNPDRGFGLQPIETYIHSILCDSVSSLSGLSGNLLKSSRRKIELGKEGRVANPFPPSINGHPVRKRWQKGTIAQIIDHPQPALAFAPSAFYFSPPLFSRDDSGLFLSRPRVLLFVFPPVASYFSR